MCVQRVLHNYIRAAIYDCALVLLALNMMCNTAYTVDGEWISMEKLIVCTR